MTYGHVVTTWRTPGKYRGKWRLDSNTWASKMLNERLDPPSKNPGAWAGCIYRIDDDTVAKTISDEKWTKAKRLLTEIQEH
jgi:hypothetical protein